MKAFLLLLFWTLWYLNFSARSILSPIMPLIEDNFLISHPMAGVLFFSFWVGNTISIFNSGFISLKIGYKRSILLGLSIMVVILFIQATFSVVFFPAGLVAMSKLTTLSERSVFTGMLMSISSIVGPGLSPIVLGAVADI